MNEGAPLPQADDSGCSVACGCVLALIALLAVPVMIGALQDALGPDFWVVIGLVAVVGGVVGWWVYLARKDRPARASREPDEPAPIPVPPSFPSPGERPAFDFPRPTFPGTAATAERPHCEACGRVVDARRHRPVVCDRCGAVYHTACWNRLSGCVAAGCGAQARASAALPEAEVHIALEPESAEERGDATCPYCRYPITDPRTRLDCPSCRTPHHRECWLANGGCTTYGCRARV